MNVEIRTDFGHVPLAVELAREAASRLIEDAKRNAEQKQEDPIRAIIRAYNEMDKEMMRVVDEHIERIRKSNERNKELYCKLALQKEIEKRQELREQFFEEAADDAEDARDILLYRIPAHKGHKHI